RPQNGDNASEDGQNESEAETVVLDDAKDLSATKKKVIKTERDDDHDDAARLRSTKEHSRPRSLVPNGRKNSISEGKEVRTNGAKHGSDRDAKSVPTSPSSRTASRHAKETSPGTSPVQSGTRGRSASTVDSRKRKLREESHPKALEPPRQKAKTEAPKESRIQPTSPDAPGVGRPHKRSQSTQSALHSGPGRKRKDLTALALPIDRRHWSDSGSETSSSPRPVQTPSLLHDRVKRSSHRALTSPARNMVHKRNVDKFGATRLARESEKGDLAAVKAAYFSAPEELDQEDFAGITPLQKAALQGNDDVVTFLIQQGCRTDCESNDRDTPLIDAVENGHLAVVKILLNQGRVNPHHQNKKGQRAIDVLDPEDSDAEDIERELKTAMRRESAPFKNEEETTPGFPQQKTAPNLLYNEYNLETLIEKAGSGDIAAVGELINSNIKPNIACGVAASRGGYDEILSILLASGLKPDPDPSKHTETPMVVAIGRNNLEVIKLLLAQDTFNPTRRNREGQTYWEISEEKRGPKWEQERELLKNAYDEYLRKHKSPKRSKKEAPNPGAVRAKRKPSPLREQSSSPRPESKRSSLPKSSTASQGPQKSRRLMTGKEMASRDVKRRRRVVSEETSDEDDDDEVRPPMKKATAKPRSFSEGEDEGHKPVKKPAKGRWEDDHPNRKIRAGTADSEEDTHRQKSGPKIRTKLTNVKSTPTPDAESPDERKAVKNKIRSRIMEEKVKKRRASDVSIDDRVKKTPTVSAKSTPAPPEKASTPESGRERREDQERQAADEEAKKKADEEAKRKADEEAKRKADEEAKRKADEDARKKAEAEAAAEAEAKRLAEVEAARKLEEEEARRRAEEEDRRQQALAARRDRISKLPRALRVACERGNNRPLHFKGEEMGISLVFLPLRFAKSKDLLPEEPMDAVPKSYIMSFQAVGILGLPELDLAHMDVPYSKWDRIPVTRQQRELFLQKYDVGRLAQEFRFPMKETAEAFAQRLEMIREARTQFLEMEGLYWIEDSVLVSEVEKVDYLLPLLDQVKDRSTKWAVDVVEPKRTGKTFMDVLL
ncbi:hypothetical protein B0J11DRAFT_398378, partial [Dendryphion nanum]